MWLTDRAGATYRFDPGAPCLELAHTGGPAWRAAFESLHTPDDLGAYLAGHLGGEAHAGPGLRAPSEPVAPDQATPELSGPVTERDLVAVVALRDAIWQCVDARMASRRLPEAAVATINARAADPPVAWRIAPEGQRTRAEPVTVAQLAASFARDAVDLLTDPGASGRLRRCGADDCFLVFLDASRPGRRRWCSMERCGNRAKVRHFRHRSTRHPREDTRP